MTDPGAWLTERLAGAPESLREAVQGAAGSVQRDVPGGLIAAAERVLASSDASDASALDLLSADTLITLACEWVAEHDPERLGDLK